MLLPLLAQRTGNVGTVWQQVRDSTTLSKRLYSVNDWRVLALGVAAAAASLTAFTALQELINANSIANGYAGPVDDLLILDLRGGYTPEAVSTVLTNWGSLGRRLYLLIEFIDVTVYCTAYRAAGLVFANRVAAALSASRVPAAGRLAALLVPAPAVLAAIDLLEDCGQVSLTLLFELGASGWSSALGGLAGGDFWQGAVTAASSVSVLKWAFLRLTVTCIAVEVGVLALAAAAARLGGEKPDI